MKRYLYLILILLFLMPFSAMAQGAVATTPVLNAGNTAWITMATILVMLMTVPGLALFYGGLVRQKNVLSIIMQCLICVCVVSVLWVAFGYSWVFGKGFQGLAIVTGKQIGRAHV